jgi:hypothetical protein
VDEVIHGVAGGVQADVLGQQGALGLFVGRGQQTKQAHEIRRLAFWQLCNGLQEHIGHPVGGHVLFVDIAKFGSIPRAALIHTDSSKS